MNKNGKILRMPSNKSLWCYSRLWPYRYRQIPGVEGVDNLLMRITSPHLSQATSVPNYLPMKNVTQKPISYTGNIVYITLLIVYDYTDSIPTYFPKEDKSTKGMRKVVWSMK